MLWWVWFRKVGLCYNINRKIKAETGATRSGKRLATYPLMMASQNSNKEKEKKAMSRERMVTRTVFSTNYNVMVVNMESKSVESITVTIPSADTMTDKAREKAIKAMIPEGKTFVTITGETTSETLYGMTEAEFIRLARVLPPRTKTE